MFQYKFNEAECRYLNKSFISSDIKSLPGGKYLLPSMPTSHIIAMAAIYYWTLKWGCKIDVVWGWGWGVGRDH